VSNRKNKILEDKTNQLPSPAQSRTQLPRSAPGRGSNPKLTINKLWRRGNTNGDFAVSLHDADLNVLGASLYNLQKTLHGELDALIARQIVFVVLFEEFADGF
jgi:hypothetical protein